MNGRRLGLAAAALVILGVALIGAGVLLSSSSGNDGPGWFGGMMGDNRPAVDSGPQPGDTGFVAGTADSPRLIQIIAGPGYTFTPSTVTVQRGETVTFAVTTVGPLEHEFMVGPADAVAADQEGTPEIADIGMMQTKNLTYTFDGSGPYAFACHAPGHYEAGMRGTITVVG
jgi:plastocyanin